MITLSKCPKCGDNLLNELIDDVEMVQSCNKRMAHRFYLLFNTETNEPVTMTYYHNMKRIIYWDFIDKRINIKKVVSMKIDLKQPKLNQPSIIPWFEPDLSNFNQLIKKIDTYVLFS